MTHAPEFWAVKLPKEWQPTFWGLVNAPEWWLRLSGETAYQRIVARMREE